jgi:hypothetical protein
METITVYRVDSVRKDWTPIGKVAERRKNERGDNLVGLLRLARKTFASSPEDALHIAIDDVEARRQEVLIRF